MPGWADISGHGGLPRTVPSFGALLYVQMAMLTITREPSRHGCSERRAQMSCALKADWTPSPSVAILGACNPLEDTPLRHSPVSQLPLSKTTSNRPTTTAWPATALEHLTAVSSGNNLQIRYFRLRLVPAGDPGKGQFGAERPLLPRRHLPGRPDNSYLRHSRDDADHIGRHGQHTEAGCAGAGDRLNLTVDRRRSYDRGRRD